MQDKMAGVHFLPLPQSYLKMRDEHAPQISALPPLPSPAPTSSHPALKKNPSDYRITHGSLNYEW